MRIFRRIVTNRSVLIGGSIVLLTVLVSFLSQWIVPYDPIKQNLALAMDGPSREHLLGCDALGRDILSRIIAGAQFSLSIGLSAVALSAFFGILLGTIAAYYGRLVDEVIMRLIDLVMAFPSILLALVTITILGPGLRSTIIAVSIASIPRFARLAHSSVLTLKACEFVEAAHTVGQRDLWIIGRHILPNCISPLLVQASLLAAEAILIGSGLGFLGLGAQPPTPEWGTMLSDGRALLRAAPHVATFPGLAILVVSLAFNLFGDGLRDALDVRL